MAEIIKFPVKETVWSIQISLDKSPDWNIIPLDDNRRLIMICARFWEEAVQLRKQAADYLKNERQAKHPPFTAGTTSKELKEESPKRKNSRPFRLP